MSVTIPTNDEEYELWLLNSQNQGYQVLLLEFDNSVETVRMSSKAFISSANKPYDNWIKSKPYMEDALYNFVSVGDVDVINMDDDNDWMNRTWGGHQSRWYFGDLRWPRESFKQIATCTISECRFIGERVFRFDLLDNGYKFSKPFVDSDVTKTLTVSNAVQWVIETANVSVIMPEIDNSKLNINLQFTVTTTTSVEAVLRNIARSIGAELRVNQLGNAEIFIINKTSIVTLTEDEISITGLSMSSVLPAYNRVSVLLYDDTKYTQITGANTGEFDNEKEIKTYLTTQSDAEILLSNMVTIYAIERHVWTVSVLILSVLLNVGDVITIQHDQLKNSGIVTTVNRSPLSNFTDIEVTI